MDFHDKKNRYSYTTRSADSSWLELIANHVRLTGATAADVGCGGGIYTRALVELGADDVVGIDFSQAMLDGAAAQNADLANVRVHLGNALQTGLADESVGVVLERALIHHLTDAQLTGCFAEAYRILRPGGTLIVQDRTPEDCLIEGSRQHLRGYFFEKFPSLIVKEVSRRHSMAAVTAALANAGLHGTESLVLWETRKRYDSFSDFRGDITKRTGRSLLHELTDSELAELVRHIQAQTGYNDHDSIEEQDRWTVWIARKH